MTVAQNSLSHEWSYEERVRALIELEEKIDFLIAVNLNKWKYINDKIKMLISELIFFLSPSLKREELMKQILFAGNDVSEWDELSFEWVEVWQLLQ